MKKELFGELIESIEEAGKIRKGLLEPSRVFTYGRTTGDVARYASPPSRACPEALHRQREASRRAAPQPDAE